MISLYLDMLGKENDFSSLRGANALSRAADPSPAALRASASQPCGHFGSYTPHPCLRGFAAPSPAFAGRGEIPRRSQALDSTHHSNRSVL